MTECYRSVVRGFHVPTQQELAIAKPPLGNIVGEKFPEYAATLLVGVAGRRQRSFLPEGGFEIPCIYKFQGTSNST